MANSVQRPVVQSHMFQRRMPDSPQATHTFHLTTEPRTMSGNVNSTGTLCRKSLKDIVRCVHDSRCGNVSFMSFCRHFAPAWFAVTMGMSLVCISICMVYIDNILLGTGSIAILFYNFPYATESPVMRGFTLAFFFFNFALFMLFSAISAARYILFPQIWSRMIQHPVQSLYIGTFPMGATTLINIASADLFQTYGFGGKPFIYTVWACWWINVAISLVCCFGMVHVMSVSSRFSEII